MIRWPAPPPGPFREATWRSPLRGTWVASVLGLVLLPGMALMVLTGLLSYAAYNPRLGRNDLTPDRGLLGFYLFDWPASPSWLYRLNQGLHVIVGIALIPVIIAKLWTVAPKLYEWPPVRSVAQALERINIALIIGGALFQVVTGVLNIQYAYLWHFSFYRAHLYGAWVFLGAFAAHVMIKLPTALATVRGRPVPGATHRDGHVPVDPFGEPDPDHVASPEPRPVTLTRGRFLGLVGGASAFLLALTAGQTLGGPLRRLALLAPRGRDYGSGPNDFQVNKTAAEAGITKDRVLPGAWQLVVSGRRSLTFSRDELLALPQHEAELPIACVEGWSTVQRWSGVRLADLAAKVGLDDVTSALVESIQTAGSFTKATLSGTQVRARDALLALRVNGADLSLDHGFPARVIVPANPGVHNTKWVGSITFVSGGDAGTGLQS